MRPTVFSFFFRIGHLWRRLNRRSSRFARRQREISSDTTGPQEDLVSPHGHSAREAWIARVSERAPHLLQQWHLSRTGQPLAPDRRQASGTAGKEPTVQLRPLDNPSSASQGRAGQPLSTRLVKYNGRTSNSQRENIYSKRAYWIGLASSAVVDARQSGSTDKQVRGSRVQDKGLYVDRLHASRSNKQSALSSIGMRGGAHDSAGHRESCHNQKTSPHSRLSLSLSELSASWPKPNTCSLLERTEFSARQGGVPSTPASVHGNSRKQSGGPESVRSASFWATPEAHPVYRPADLEPQTRHKPNQPYARSAVLPRSPGDVPALADGCMQAADPWPRLPEDPTPEPESVGRWGEADYHRRMALEQRGL